MVQFRSRNDLSVHRSSFGRSSSLIVRNRETVDRYVFTCARHAPVPQTATSQGVEVGLVAKLAGHANAVVTLGHYTQAVRGGQAAVAALERAYAAA